jgi:WD40 repeat protein
MARQHSGIGGNSRARVALFGAMLAASFALVPVGQAAPEDDPPAFRALAFSPDGRLLAACSGEPKEAGELVVWDVQTGKPRLHRREKRGIPAVAFAPDGKTLAFGCFDEHCRLLDVNTGKVTALLPGHGEAARAVAFSPDGKTLAVGSYDHTVRLWNVATRQGRQTLKGHTEPVYAVAFSPDGAILTSSGSGFNTRLWDVDKGQSLHHYTNERMAAGAAMDAKGRWLLTGNPNGYVLLRELRSGKLLLQLRLWVGQQAALAPDGLALAAARPRGVYLFTLDVREPSAAERKRIAELIALLDDDAYEVREKAGNELLKIGVLAEPELRRAAKASPSAEVRIRARTLCTAVRAPEPRLILKGHTEEVLCVAFDPDGRLVASGSKDGTVRVWDRASGRERIMLVPPKRAPFPGRGVP